ncbi:MAG: hypothetical protein E2P02_21050 [Acidobacteria bacterium]|nr:MAG: hypothetical protein E2P02_21050 [Acidobacteriota bacterium]
MFQVAVDEPLVDWRGNCGNLTSAVGVCALDAGLVEPTEPVPPRSLFPSGRVPTKLRNRKSMPRPRTKT